MTTERSTSHAAEGDNAFVDRLLALGLGRKAPTAKPASPFVSAPSAPAGDAGALSRRLAAIPGATRNPPATAAAPAPVPSPYGSAAEIPPPIAATRAAGPIVRHFRVLAPKMQTRVINGAIRQPDPAA